MGGGAAALPCHPLVHNCTLKVCRARSVAPTYRRGDANPFGPYLARLVMAP